jgi:RHS repeat-associated protein
VSALSYPVCTHAGCTAPATFADVPQGAPFQREIEAIYPGITAGCGGSNYCPNNNITRGEMAVYLLRGKEGQAYTPPDCSVPIFGDVPCTDPLARWINELYRRGITSGCSASPLLYCPNNFITNAEMAVFVVQLLFQGTGFTVPPCSSAPYADVPCTYWAAAWIAEEARRQVTTGCGGGSFCPSSYVTRASMAGLIVHAFDIPYKIDPGTQRNVQFAYTQGLLTGVTGGGTAYGSLSYYPNLLVSQVAHGNGLLETQGNDPFEMRRPAALGASGPYTSWGSGSYAYDGAGNIKTIGSSTFTYDPVSRLVSSALFDGTNGGSTQKLQSYTFDAFGNLTSIAGTSGRNTPTSPQTNHLNAAGTVYDAAGNLTNWNGAAYQYDAFNQMIRMTSGTEDWAYLYTADDERLWSYNLANNSRWTIRDLNGKVLREYINNGGWSVGTDYIYRDGLLLAAETQTGQRHFHLDHLGTPRLITRAGGEKVAYHVYYPFGEEATAFNQDSERMKFTGHERDLASATGAEDDLDYMHARHESPVTGRFLSPDKAQANPHHVQSWNRYTYCIESPLRYVDPNGLEPLDPSVRSFLEGYYNADFSKVQVHGGFFARLLAGKNTLAITFGNHIFLGKSGWSAYASIHQPQASAANAIEGIALAGHEVTHALQARQYGLVSFLARYLLQWAQVGFDYWKIPFEREAYVNDSAIAKLLLENPNLLQSIRSGGSASVNQAPNASGWSIVTSISAGSISGLSSLFDFGGELYIDGINLTGVLSAARPQ